jgi:RNA polymerase sigma-70 factor (ECF subfamily)
MRLSGVIDRITLGRALDELPEGCRQIFTLHEVQGYQHHEIARMLDCSVGNSKSQLHKAKMKMRDLLFPKRRVSRRPTASRPLTSDDRKKSDRPQLSLLYGGISR